MDGIDIRTRKYYPGAVIRWGRESPCFSQPPVCMINICYCMELLELPLKGNYDPDNYRIYFRYTGLLIGSLDEEAQEDLRANKNFNTYKGAIYKNIVGDMLVKQGYKLYFYKNGSGTVEMDFFVRDRSSLIPVEVKAGFVNVLGKTDKTADFLAKRSCIC